jgi:SAM-dependent methyltransferase
MAKNREIVECFKRYRALKKDDYHLVVPDLHSVNNTGKEAVTSAHTFIPKHSDRKSYKIEMMEEPIVLERNEDGSVKIARSVNVRTVDETLIKRLSPDTIDSREFWREAHKDFSLFSICGHPVKDRKEANEVNTAIAKRSGALDCLVDTINNIISGKRRHASMLEIGPGFGNIYELVKDEHAVIYTSIDVYPAFDHPRMYQTDGKTIPWHITSMDIAYSCNVFQHLSKSQRSSYYKQIYNRLNEGGVFIFNMFVRSEENKKLPLWGVRDESGRYYTQFFRQLTEVDELDELTKELNEIGFEVEILTPERQRIQHNVLTFKCSK